MLCFLHYGLTPFPLKRYIQLQRFGRVARHHDAEYDSSAFTVSWAHESGIPANDIWLLLIYPSLSNFDVKFHGKSYNFEIIFSLAVHWA